MVMSMKTLSLGAKLATDCAQHADTEEEKSRHSARTVEEEASYSSNLSLTESARILSSPHKKSQLYDLIEVVLQQVLGQRAKLLKRATCYLVVIVVGGIVLVYMNGGSDE